MTSLRLISPILALTGFALALFGVDAFANPSTAKRSPLSFALAIVGLITGALLIPCMDFNTPLVFGRGMLVADGLSFALSWISLLTTLLAVMLSEQDRALAGTSRAVYYGMLLLSATGLLVAVSANDFIMIFLSIEMVGIPAFILTAYLKKSQKSGEAAMKFFLIGAFSSAMLVYGASILYGITGSTSLTVLQQSTALLQEKAPLTLLAVFFILVSFGFKIALVPFHMWVPDTFEGAPIPIAGFLSAAPKMAGIALAIRVFGFTLPSGPLGAIMILAILAGLTMTIANVIGLQQKNVVRLLAYSSIAHMGYALLGLVAGGTDGIASIYLYGLIYLFMNLGAFTVVSLVSNAQDSTDLSAFAGLAKRAPALSAILVLFLISLAGLPPTAGFVAKFYVFSATYNAGWFWLLVIAAVNSVISVGYYFKILHAMYFQAPADTTPIELPLQGRMVLAVTSFVTVFLGVAPNVGLTNVRKLIAVPVVAAEPAPPVETPQ